MLRQQRGVTTIECLVALVILAIGVLGATGTTALAIRAATEGTEAAAAARLAGSRLDSLAEVAARVAGCAALVAGADSSARGPFVRWVPRPGPGAMELLLVLGYSTARGVHSDTIWSAVSCA